ncbi:MAG: hypothetical protein ILNGONEN_00806 [Syntrophorhabdaceae bacterium]|nr:hypothetical protein [Syntrophorhabdaceae bacterium]
MSLSPRIFISHSTQDKRDHLLAHNLSASLTERGAQIWIAPDNIPVGSEWKKEIVAAVMKQCTHFLVILSASSVASKWVLDEIDLAKQRRQQDLSFTIIPLSVGTIGEYPGSDFISQFQFAPYKDDFSAQLDTIISCLSLRANVPNLHREAIDDFVGRSHVFSAIEHFFSIHKNGCFIIVGDPGEGKSSIMAEYVRRTGNVAHFNSRAEGINRTKQCLGSIASQLEARFGGSVGTLPADPAEYSTYWRSIFSSSYEKFKLAHGTDSTSRLVIVIDALDEVDRTDHPKGSNTLFLPRHIPEGVFLLLSRRREQLPFVSHGPIQVFDLIDYSTDNRKDVETYILKKMGEAALRNWIQSRKISDNEFISRFADKSEYNFMYLRHVLSEITAGNYGDLDLDRLPVGLQAYYEDHWERMGMMANPLPTDKIRILYIIAEMRRPVSRKLIADMTKQDPIIVQAVLDEWKPFLHYQIIENQLCHSIYHTSFLDFLHRKDIVKAAGETIEGVHAMIAIELLKGLKEDE